MTASEYTAIRRDVVAADALAREDSDAGRAEYARQEAEARHAIAQIRIVAKHPALAKAKHWNDVELT